MANQPAGIVIRRLAAADLPAALAIQATNYPPFLREDIDAFASRLAVPATYCLAAVRGKTVLGYLLAHGWASAAPPPIGTVLATDVAGDVLFIHDLAISPAAQGADLGRSLVDHGSGLAGGAGLRHAELIAVAGAASYWRRLGFTATATPPALAAKVATYGAEARWMSRNISSRP